MSLYDEEKVKKIIKSDVNLPLSYRNMIRKTLKQCEGREEEHLKIKFTRILASCCIATILIFGVVYAGYTIYEKVWKEPKKVTYEEMINELPNEKIDEEEKRNYITEEEAKQKAEDFLKNIGYTNIKLIIPELKRSYDNQTSAYYMIRTDESYNKGIIITVNAENGKVTHFEDMDLKNENINADNITEDEAKKILEDNLSIVKEDYSDYEFFEITKINNYISKSNTSAWYIKYCKKYNDVFNPNEMFGVIFIVQNQKLVVCSLGLKEDNTFQNNEVIITEEEAKSICEEKEKEYTNEDIVNIYAELGIEKMNTFFYDLDNNEDLKDKFLQIPDISRNVWKVTIMHNKKEDLNIYESTKELIKQYSNKCYYIDATTGEIIGGKEVEN